MSETNGNSSGQADGNGKEGTLRTLSCSNCGAPLKPETQTKGGYITCEYCNQSHQFISHPAPAQEQPTGRFYVTGDPVLVLWDGYWWKAHVLEQTGQDQWLIHYDGWASSWDETVGPSRIRPSDHGAAKPARIGSNKPRWARMTAGIIVTVVLGFLAFAVYNVIKTTIPEPKKPVEEPKAVEIPFFQAGDKVQAQWKGEWYPATVLWVKKNGKIRIHYDNYDFKHDELAGPGRLQPTTKTRTKTLPVQPDTTLTIGQKLQVHWNDTWYLGEILTLEKDGKVNIHYISWDPQYDETVTRDRLYMFPR